MDCHGGQRSPMTEEKKRATARTQGLRAPPPPPSLRATEGSAAIHGEVPRRAAGAESPDDGKHRRRVEAGAAPPGYSRWIATAACGRLAMTEEKKRATARTQGLRAPPPPPSLRAPQGSAAIHGEVLRRVGGAASAGPCAPPATPRSGSA